MRAILICILIGLSLPILCQEQPNIDESVIVHLNDHSCVKGEQINSSDSDITIVIITGDTIVLDKSLIKTVISYKDFFFYPKMRYHFKDGFHIDLNYGFGFAESGGLVTADLSLNYRFTPKISGGIGFGAQNNHLFINERNAVSGFSVSSGSFPLFFQGKYYLNRKRRSLYAHLKTGYTFGNDSAWDVRRTVDNGFILNYGIGYTRATKSGVKTFFQISQTHNYTSGSDVSFGTNGPINFDYNLWFNRFSVSWGLEFNLGKRPN